MKTARYKVAKQNGGFGLYAEVSLEIKPCKKEFVNVKFHENVDKEWQLPCLEGIDYAYEKMQQKLGVEVKITDLDWNPVDTKSIAVKFAAAMAFWQAMGYKPDPAPKIHKIDKGGFRVVFN